MVDSGQKVNRFFWRVSAENYPAHIHPVVSDDVPVFVWTGTTTVARDSVARPRMRKVCLGMDVVGH